ncbi:hypothetical protein [Rhodococcus rhodochrous]|uniref:hypothetical protein n=1 Tax=Rhodococcus rhodochrous TaxID=1829 RepID=UPI0002E3C60F|nr:hypothetical protein [Rhodococcus rhodochrous]
MGDLAQIDDEGSSYVVDRIESLIILIIRAGESFCVEVESMFAAAPAFSKSQSLQ